MNAGEASVSAVKVGGRPVGQIGRLLVYGSVAYVALSTADYKVASIPLKLFVVVPALVWWGLSARVWQRRREFTFALPVLLVAVLVPALWLGVAAWLHHGHDAAQRHTLRFALQEGSRFVYLLLYFPVVAEMRRRPGWEGAGIWLWPAVLLALVTWALYLGHAVLGADYGYSGTVGPFQGAVAVDGVGTLRVFLVDDVIFLPAFALLIADLLLRGLTRRSAGLAVLLLSATFLAHTRGLWLAVLTTIAIVIAGSWPRPRLTGLRRGAFAAAALAGVVGLVLSADPALARSVVSRLTGAGELSTGLRLAQAPQLLHGFSRHPLLGSGLGATLPSGYARSATDPWTFELTYLQLLFQLGLVGTVLVSVPAGIALVRAARATARAAGRSGIRALAGLGVTAGFILTTTGNPYLVTSVGMLTLAIVLALIESAAPAPMTSLALSSRPAIFSAWRARAG